MNQFIEVVYKKVLEITEDPFLKFAIRVYGMLVSLGGIKIAQFIEKNVTSQMKSIQNQSNRQVSAALLVELFKQANFITYNRVRKFDMIKLIKSLIQEKKEQVRTSCLEFIDECIKETCKRDRRFLRGHF